MRFSFDTLIPAPREAVFDFLGDPGKRTLWQTSIRSLEMEPQGEPRVGVHWRESVRGAGTFDMEISEYEAPVRWAERIQSRRFVGTVAMSFAEEAGVTVVTLEADVRCLGLMRLFDPIGRFVLQREMRKDLGRVEGLLAATDGACASRQARGSR